MLQLWCIHQGPRGFELSSGEFQILSLRQNKFETLKSSGFYGFSKKSNSSIRKRSPPASASAPYDHVAWAKNQWLPGLGEVNNFGGQVCMVVFQTFLETDVNWYKFDGKSWTTSTMMFPTNKCGVEHWEACLLHILYVHNRLYRKLSKHVHVNPQNALFMCKTILYEPTNFYTICDIHLVSTVYQKKRDTTRSDDIWPNQKSFDGAMIYSLGWPCTGKYSMSN